MEMINQISAVIVTHNRKGCLKNCLDSIFSQTCPSNKYEIIVVDNASIDNTYGLVKKLQKTHKNLILVKESRKGICYARNAGIKASKSEIVAFTDDDCIVDKDWIEKIIFYHKKYPAFAGIGGKVINGNPKLTAQAIQIISHRWFDNSDKIKSTGSIMGGNMSFKRKIFKKFSFDNSIEYGGDENLLCCELTANKERLLFVPEIKVTHFAENKSLAICLKNRFKSGINSARIRKKFNMPKLKKKNEAIKSIRLKIMVLLLTTVARLGYLYGLLIR